MNWTVADAFLILASNPSSRRKAGNPLRRGRTLRAALARNGLSEFDDLRSTGFLLLRLRQDSFERSALSGHPYMRVMLQHVLRDVACNVADGFQLLRFWRR